MILYKITTQKCQNRRQLPLLLTVHSNLGDMNNIFLNVERDRARALTKLLEAVCWNNVRQGSSRILEVSLEDRLADFLCGVGLVTGVTCLVDLSSVDRSSMVRAGPWSMLTWLGRMKDHM